MELHGSFPLARPFKNKVSLVRDAIRRSREWRPLSPGWGARSLADLLQDAFEHLHDDLLLRPGELI
jgi:hypothetical protein